jgi:Zn-dependent protease
MRDPLTWSFPLGRLFGVTIRVHLFFPLVALGLILRVAFQREPPLPEGVWIDVSVILALLFFAVLLHEYGHCFAARWVDGDAQEILLWPLGGLAYVEVPHTARANFLTALGGPLVNLALCIVCGLVLMFAFSLAPPLNPFNLRDIVRGAGGLVSLAPWGANLPDEATLRMLNSNLAVVLLARFFWVNWVLFLINVVLIGFPLDGGRMFQCILWRYVGYRQATLAAIFAGFLTMFVVGLFAIIVNELLPLFLAAFIYVACKQQWLLLETGGEESLFGYDFSQGYTSLERDQPPPAPRRRQNWLQRWLQRRAARRLQREQEVREAEERRMDELLEKVQRLGLSALTDEERRFLKRVSDRYRNRH